MAEVKIIYKTL